MAIVVQIAQDQYLRCGMCLCEKKKRWAVTGGPIRVTVVRGGRAIREIERPLCIAVGRFVSCPGEARNGAFGTRVTGKACTGPG